MTEKDNWEPCEGHLGFALLLLWESTQQAAPAGHREWALVKMEAGNLIQRTLMPVAWAGWVPLACNLFSCLFWVSCIHYEVPASGYFVTWLHFLLYGCVKLFRIYIFSALLCHMRIWRLLCLLRMTFLALVNELQGLGQAVKQSNEPVLGDALFDMRLMDNLWGGHNSCCLWFNA